MDPFGNSEIGYIWATQINAIEKNTSNDGNGMTWYSKGRILWLYDEAGQHSIEKQPINVQAPGKIESRLSAELQMILMYHAYLFLRSF